MALIDTGQGGMGVPPWEASSADQLGEVPGQLAPKVDQRLAATLQSLAFGFLP